MKSHRRNDQIDEEKSNKRQKPNNKGSDQESGSEDEDDMTSTLALNNEASKFGKNRDFGKHRDAKRLIVVLENACLESVKIGSIYELLNCDRHKQQIIKFKKDPSQCRPDIFHKHPSN